VTTDQEYCKATLAEWAGGEHHLDEVKPFGAGVCVNWMGDLSTYDFDGLTRLVILAHRDGVRIGVKSGGPRMVKIMAFRRTLGELIDGRQTGLRGSLPMSQWHPGLDHLIAQATVASDKAAKVTP
jgi:hypothetical protein